MVNAIVQACGCIYKGSEAPVQWLKPYIAVQKKGVIRSVIWWTRIPCCWTLKNRTNTALITRR